MSAIKLAATALSPAGAAARLSILIFHRVHAEPDPLFPGEMDARRFAELLRWLGNWFRVLPLDEAVRRLHAGELPARAAAITFDDGYADNCTVAMPLLQAAGMSATFFITTGFLEQGRMWNDTLIEAVRGSPLDTLDLRELAPAYADLAPLDLRGWEGRRAAVEALIGRTKYLPMAQRLELVEAVARASRAGLGPGPMMSHAQLRRMHAQGMGIGAHTVSHPILATLEPAQARDEIRRSKSELEALLDARVGLFAYTNGKPGADYRPEHVEMVREAGFDAAVSTVAGSAHRGSQRFELPRFTPWERGRGRVGLRLLANLRRG